MGHRRRFRSQHEVVVAAQNSERGGQVACQLLQRPGGASPTRSVLLNIGPERP